MLVREPRGRVMDGLVIGQDRKIGSSRSEGLGHAEADSAACSRDQHGFVFEAE